MFIFFVFLRLRSGHLLLSASTYFIVRALSCVICILPISEFLCFFFRLVFLRNSYQVFLGWRFFCALVPGTLARGLPTSII